MYFFYLNKKLCFVLDMSNFLCFCEIHRFQNLWCHHRHCYIMEVTFMLISYFRNIHPEMFFNEIWNIYWKVFFKNSCSEHFREIPGKTLATELIFNIVMCFQFVLCPKWFSRNFLKIFRAALSKSTTGRMLLISSDYALKILKTHFNPLMPGGNKMS